MTYQTQLQPWCIVRQLPEMKRVIINRFRHYRDADARVQLLRQQTPGSQFDVLFAPEATTLTESGH